MNSISVSKTGFGNQRLDEKTFGKRRFLIRSQDVEEIKIFIRAPKCTSISRNLSEHRLYVHLVVFMVLVL